MQTFGAFATGISTLLSKFSMGNRNILRDENQFKDPHVFSPERYLEPVDEETAKRRDPRNYTFGFGRRVRPLYLFIYIS